MSGDVVTRDDRKMPDWRYRSQYPDPKTTSSHRWAWEFLCRNPDFVAELEWAEKKQGAMRRAAAKRHEVLAEHELRKPLFAVLRKRGVDLPIMPAWRARGLLDSPVHFDAAPREVPRMKYRGQWGDPPGALDGQWIHFAPTRNDRLVLEFDLLVAPIDAQLKRAKAMLEGTRRTRFPRSRSPRFQPEKLRLYLRVLDSLEAPLKERLAVFQVDERQFRRWVREARALRDDGYRELVKR